MESNWHKPHVYNMLRQIMAVSLICIAFPALHLAVNLKTSERTPMIPMPISVENAHHYRWGEGCDGWHLVRAAGVSVIEERMPAGTVEVRHWHARAIQFFYVLTGTLVMEVEGARHELAAGSGIELPAGTAHQARNEGAVDTTFLVISSPPHQGDRRDAPLGES